MASRWVRRALFQGDERGVVYLDVEDATAIALGDLLVYESGVVYPMTEISAGSGDIGLKAQNQAWASAYFAGVAMRSHAAASGATTIPVSTQGIWEFDCDSADWTAGDLVGVTGTGTGGNDGLSNTSVVAVASPSLAIGRCFKSSTSVTRVQVELASSLTGRLSTLNLPSSYALQSLAAAGSTQGDAGVIVERSFIFVSAADGTKGVVLPTPSRIGQQCFIYNSVATNGLKIYPQSGGGINGGSVNAPIVIEGKTLAILVAYTLSTWAAIYTVDT